MSRVGIKNIVGTVRHQSLKLHFLLISGHKGSVREERATKYESVPKIIYYKK
jgi:hypothetical protein